MAKAHQIQGIDCRGAANIGIRLVLLERFDEVVRFRSEALHWEDPEGVHSMRVASRRLRSALRDFNPYIKRRGLSVSLKRIKKLADALGAVRDQDVAIEALETLAAKTAPSITKTLQKVIETRKEVREEARKNLKQTISKQELTQLKADFREAISVATYVSARSGAELSYSDLARAVIRGRLSDFEKLTEKLFKPFDVEALHELRISGKRLRYAIELFDQCWKASTLPIAKRIARLQTALGEVHDCDVWIESFGNHIMTARKQRDAAETESYAWLLSHFMKVRTVHLREAFAQWNDWEREDVSAKLRDAVSTTSR